MQKPFDVAEFLARLRAALRNKVQRQGQSAVVTSGDLVVDLVRHEVSRAGQRISLTSREYRLLSRLVEGAGRVLTHRQLAEAVWGPAQADNVQYLRVLVQHLRHKIEPSPAQPRHVLNESGIGYLFR